MKTVRIISIVLFAFAALKLISAEQMLSSARSPGSQTGKIVGVVLDKNNALIIGATIKIKKARFRQETESGEKGDFEVEVPAGVYQMTVEQPGFRRFELYPLLVKANVRESVEVHMEVEEPKGLQKVLLEENKILPTR